MDRDTFVRMMRFGSRFRKIFEWAASMRHTIPFWRDTLASADGLGEEFWRELFLEGLRPGVWELLTEKDAPSTDDLLEIGWVEENGLGVYAKIAKSNRRNTQDLVYVGMGAATQCYSWGLNGRRKQHEYDWRDGCNPNYFHRRAADKRKFNLHFVSLWTHGGVTKRDQLDSETSYLARIGSNFSEFILSKWLNGYSETSHLHIPARAWPSIDWKGTLFCNSLKELWMLQGEATSWTDLRETARRDNLGEHLEGVSEEYRAEWREARLEKRRIYNRGIQQKLVGDMTETEREDLKKYRNAGHKRRCQLPGYTAIRNRKLQISRGKNKAAGKSQYPNGRDRTKDTARQKVRRREQKESGKDMTRVNEMQVLGRARRKAAREAEKGSDSDSDFSD